MTRERPTILLVTAIINFVVGGLGLLFTLCGSLALVLTANLTFPVPAAPGGVSKPMPNVMHTLEKHLPGYMAFFVGGQALNILLAVALVIGSIGVLRLRPWGRRTCIAVALLGVAAQVAGAFYNIAYVNPAMVEYQREVAEWQQQLLPKGRAAGPTLQVQGMTTNPTFYTLSSLLAPGVVCGYAIFILVVLFLPDVRAAFRRAEPPLDVLPADDRG
jgi:hypothetical protein